MVIVDVGLDCRQTVGNCSDTAALNIIGIVTGSAVIIVFTFFNAVMNDHRQKRCRRIFGVHALNVVVYSYLEVHHIFKLFGKGCIELLVTV